jgi:segregation and condensation protein B
MAMMSDRDESTDPPADAAAGASPDSADRTAPEAEGTEPAGETDAAPVQQRASAEGWPADEPEPTQATDEAAAGEADEAAEPIDPEHDLPGKLEAALLTADRALSSSKLGEALGGVSGKKIKQTIESLNAQYEQTGRSFRIEPVAGGWKVLTLPEYANVLQALHKRQAQQKLSPAALETLAVIAYKQPILRADLEAIRGVACGEVLRGLMDRHLVKIVGRAEEIGRPMLYGTTKTFLEVFGLASLNDLPKVEQLTQPAE